VRFFVHKTTRDFTSLKTVTFGDESAVTPNRIASVVSVTTIFLIWGSFTGSAWVPGFLHAPGPFVGETEFTYTLETNDGARDDATVHRARLRFRRGNRKVSRSIPARVSPRTTRWR
jgi:taurine transport system permease protein